MFYHILAISSFHVIPLADHAFRVSSVPRLPLLPLSNAKIKEGV